MIPIKHKNLLISFIGVALILLLQFLNARGLLSSYAYWNDEVFSVATAQSSWPSLFSVWVIPDTAPPLYPVVLKLWISLWGSTESTTRLLSFIAATASLFIVSFYSRKAGKVAFFSSIVYLGTSPVFSRYGQETRNYALVLLLSSISLISFLASSYPKSDLCDDKSDRVFRISILLLSLTHYFAFIYSICLLTCKTLLFRHAISKSRQLLIKDLMTLLLLLIWPFYHLLIARPISSPTLLAWNQVQPVVGTLSNLAKALFGSAQGNISVTFAIIFLVGVVLFHCRLFPQPQKNLLVLLVLSSVGFVVAIIVSDIITKSFSTERNFIVLLPAATLIISRSLQSIHDSYSNQFAKWFPLVVAIFVAIQQYNTSANNLLFGKLVPFENLKQISIALKEANVCEKQKCLSSEIGAWWREVYFQRYQISVARLPSTRSADLSPNEVLITTGAGISQALRRLNSNSSFSCFQPRQHWDRSFVLLAHKDLVEQMSLHGLHQISCSRG